MPSGEAASFEGGEAFANVDRGPQLTIEPVDPGVDPPDLRDQLGPERAHLGPERTHLGGHLGPERVDLDRQAGVDAVYLLVQAGDLLVQEADVAAERVDFRCDDVLASSVSETWS